MFFWVWHTWEKKSGYMFFDYHQYLCVFQVQLCGGSAVNCWSMPLIITMLSCHWGLHNNGGRTTGISISTESPLVCLEVNYGIQRWPLLIPNRNWPFSSAAGGVKSGQSTAGGLFVFSPVLSSLNTTMQGHCTEVHTEWLMWVTKAQIHKL